MVAITKSDKKNGVNMQEMNSARVFKIPLTRFTPSVYYAPEPAWTAMVSSKKTSTSSMVKYIVHKKTVITSSWH